MEMEQGGVLQLAALNGTFPGLCRLYGLGKIASKYALFMRYDRSEMMPTSAERNDLIAKIANFPNILESNIAELNDEQLDIPVRAGEWTVRQIVHHLADAHLNGYVRMKLILTETKPLLKPYDQDAWSMLSDMKGAMPASLQILRGLHERWAGLLENLPEESWSRSGVHLEDGLVTLDQLLAHYVHHGEVHLEQINQLQV
jgi:hypothetical protein